MVSEDAQSAFTDWLKQQGGYVNPKASLFHELPSGDRGVYAAADIEEGEQLLLVPVSCTLHLDVTDARGTELAATCDKELAAFLTQQQQPAAADKQQQKPFSSFLATTLMLMSELAKDGSSYAPYFATLPQGTDCLINWTEQEQLLLEGTSLSDVTRSIRDIFESDIAPKLAARPDLFPKGCVSNECFRRAADMVQTRAFHMSADNWITGTHQESTDELYLIPAIDMLNHSTDPSRRNTSLALCHGDVEVQLGGGQVKSFTNFFSMKAEKAIPAGTQILHTYGDLADAQLLQTYGFIDITPQQQQQQQQQQDEADDKQQLLANPHNYVVLQLQDLLESVKTVAAAAKIWPAKKAKQVLSKRVSHLASVGLLQQHQPESSQLMVTAANTLPDELLTIIQVLMMTDSEFKQLQQAEQDEQQEAAAAAAGSSKQQQNGLSSKPAVTLNLGRDMLEDEFGELCGAVLLQAIDRWCARYPRDLKASLSALEAAAGGSRAWLAAAVCVGEQLLLQQLKKGALMIMLGAAQGDHDDEDEGEELDIGSSDEQEDEAAEEQIQAAAAAAAAAGGSKKRSRKEQPAEDHKHDHKHKHHDHKHNKHQHKQHKSVGVKDDRPHYGDMTGPAEVDVWQSDDSDKVGYSSDSEDEGERHPADPSEHHTYEVGAAGAVREAHGHMLGPDEAALIESDDSDKVGYADEEETAAEAAAQEGKTGGAAVEASSKRRRQAAPAAGAGKKPKKGLGYKG